MSKVKTALPAVYVKFNGDTDWEYHPNGIPFDDANKLHNALIVEDGEVLVIGDVGPPTPTGARWLSFRRPTDEQVADWLAFKAKEQA